MIATGFVQLSAHGQAQYSLGSLFLPNVNVASLGTVTVQAHTDNGAVLLAYGWMINNNTGEPIFFAGE